MPNIRSVQRRTFLLLSAGIDFQFLNCFTLQMFEIPSVITMVIATTRMHRSLVTFAFRPSDLYDTLFACFLSILLSVTNFALGRMSVLK